MLFYLEQPNCIYIRNKKNKYVKYKIRNVVETDLSNHNLDHLYKLIVMDEYKNNDYNNTISETTQQLLSVHILPVVC